MTVLPNEDREAHDAFCHRLIAGFNPETPLEEQLAHSIAEDAWRLNRITAIESSRPAEQAAPLARQHPATGNSFVATTNGFEFSGAEIDLAFAPAETHDDNPIHAARAA